MCNQIKYHKIPVYNIYIMLHSYIYFLINLFILNCQKQLYFPYHWFKQRAITGSLSVFTILAFFFFEHISSLHFKASHDV